ncbi:hypothetical protein TOPH_06659 [Tolypocladium ophioglossoides CBS 100239]|uniref:Uncharacterized protein n=1 Tax=Tolypocladium ophioglossoides (strain CBS 100239) TaxID=1163406 RepID=A0A0L0N3S1_TOLOC|nr:hypothetical protein TOPH_06659 [Tolypocladium ophioglossoides CBS 100239]
MQYLRDLPKGRPRNPGLSCGRVSCQWNDSIWWCNELREPKTLNGWDSIADGAQRVWDFCSASVNYKLPKDKISGQAFHPTGWSVQIFGPEKDHCG